MKEQSKKTRPTCTKDKTLTHTYISFGNSTTNCSIFSVEPAYVPPVYNSLMRDTENDFHELQAYQIRDCTNIYFNGVRS
uniref:Uncharacterized protein n=1 Tax=Oryza brachyantha TaxID=4533 RepID=J3L7H3_ORYBR